MLAKRPLMALLALLAMAAAGWAQTAEKVSGEEVTGAREAISDYIQRDVNLKGGFFLYDAELKRVIGMKFDHVHDGVTRTPEGQYFACVDMRSVRGELYDLDIYLEKTESGLKPAKIVVHKVDGEKRAESH